MSLGDVVKAREDPQARTWTVVGVAMLHLLDPSSGRPDVVLSLQAEALEVVHVDSILDAVDVSGAEAQMD